MMENQKLRIMAVGAHPDDCDFTLCGITSKLAAQGHTVHFLSLTNGNAGHYAMHGKALADRRMVEAQASAQLLNVSYDNMGIDDGRLMPSLENREALMRKIRRFVPDVILTNRPCDYHPDHRSVSVLVQDCSYLLGVPNICPDTPAMEKAPAILFWGDRFQEPLPFRPDLVIPTDAYRDLLLKVIFCHASQSMEWLIWMDGEREKAFLPLNERMDYVTRIFRAMPSTVTPLIKEKLQKQYGAEIADKVSYVECLQQSEYGAPLSSAIQNEFLRLTK